MKELRELVRENIWSLAPYSCARNESAGRTAHVFLDANENPYNKNFNRYPDPLQEEVKAAVEKVKGVSRDSIFLGNGSDEAIDLVYRCFCRPRVDNVVAIEPTYGMYRVCADINDVEYRPVLLDDGFQISSEKLLSSCDANTKVIWICSPNNPTGNDIRREEIEKTVSAFDGIVVVDEAYSDFSAARPMRLDLEKYPNMIVLNTMSKAWGCAAIRLGMAFARKDIIDIFNKVKYPYNINVLTQRHALEALADPYTVDKWIRTILEERERLIAAFRQLPFCEKIYPTSANFFLAKVTDATGTYNYLVDNGIVVRNRTTVSLCQNCLRVTVGTKGENTELLSALRQYGG